MERKRRIVMPSTIAAKRNRISSGRDRLKLFVIEVRVYFGCKNKNGLMVFTDKWEWFSKEMDGNSKEDWR